jgi:hypothetical protein
MTSRWTLTLGVLKLLRGYLIEDLSQHPEACIIVMRTMDARIEHIERVKKEEARYDQEQE